jgi:hypothetical protein
MSVYSRHNKLPPARALTGEAPELAIMRSVAAFASALTSCSDQNDVAA